MTRRTDGVDRVRSAHRDKARTSCVGRGCVRAAGMPWGVHEDFVAARQHGCVR